MYEAVAFEGAKTDPRNASSKATTLSNFKGCRIKTSKRHFFKNKLAWMLTLSLEAQAEAWRSCTASRRCCFYVLCFFHSVSFLTPPFLCDAFSSPAADPTVCILFRISSCSFLFASLFCRFLFFSLSCFICSFVYFLRDLVSVVSSPVSFCCFVCLPFCCNCCLYSAVVVQSQPPSC